MTPLSATTPQPGAFVGATHGELFGGYDGGSGDIWAKKKTPHPVDPLRRTQRSVLIVTVHKRLDQ